MSTGRNRREFLTAAGLAAAAGTIGFSAPAQRASAAKSTQPRAVKIVAVCCSPRKGRTTAAALGAALFAAKQIGPNVETELIELGGLSIPGEPAVGLPLPEGVKDDWPDVAPKLSDPAVRGILIGTPVYFSNMSYLCKAFLDRWMTFRKTFALADKVVGVLACGGKRNGGQETAIRSVQDCLFCHNMIVVGTGRPQSRFGAAVWAKDFDMSRSMVGETVAAAQALGTRVAKVARGFTPAG